VRVQVLVELNERKFTSELLGWFEENKRDFPWRREKDPYKILIAEKMLQQTTYGHVMKIYEKFIEKYPDVHSLANEEPAYIEAFIKPLGFHRQRSKQLVKLSKQVIEKHNGSIPINKGELLGLDGVGEYIANAMLCFAYGQNVPIVDVNVKRVFGRSFTWQMNDKELYENLNNLVPPGLAKQFNWAVIDFSSKVCSRKPKCRHCPCNSLCDYHKGASDR